MYDRIKDLVVMYDYKVFFVILKHIFRKYKYMLTYVMRICNTIIATIILHKREEK